MKRTAARKDLFREIWKNKGRFLSIMFIVMLGTAFFAGLRSTCHDMKYSADKYYDDTNLFDIRVLSKLGITEADVEDMKSVEGVSDVVGTYFTDTICLTKDSQLVIKVIADSGEINKPVLTEGRLPESADECLIDAGSLSESDLDVGDTIKLTAGSKDEKLSDTLNQTEFKIVGKAYMPDYISISRGTTTIGDGSVDSFIVVSPEVFKSDYYTMAYVRVSGAEELSTYSDEYWEKIDTVKGKLEILGVNASKRRYDEVLAMAKEAYATKLQELNEAIETYGEEYVYDKLGEENINAKMEEGQALIDSLEVPEWYVLDRNTVEGYVSHEQNADRMKSIGRVFPVMFFLVAALVSLTAMTRMVEEQRMQIGTLKALGYSNGFIALRYFAYAMLATLSGAIIGVALGEWFLPYIISISYGILYTGMNVYLTPINWDQAILAIVAATASTGIATIAACYIQLNSNPAKLMRPESPKSGRRVLLEKVGFIWKRTNFTQKSTIRNLLRYKKRFIMTVIGVGGCMGLLLVGFGLIDSIRDVAKNQFINIFEYNVVIDYDNDATIKQRQEVIDTVNEYGDINDSLEALIHSVNLKFGENEREAFLYVPMETENFGDYVAFRDRVTNEEYALPEEGAVITEKTANMLGLSVGDVVEICEGDAEGVKVQVVNIIENYIMHYLFISPATYERIYGEKVEPDSLLLLYDHKTEEEEAELGRLVLALPGCSGYDTVTELEATIDDMLEVLNVIVWVLIISAGLLAFVVLYNLNSINITERKRELATLKVLGFYDREVSNYVFRENLILTAIGIIFGCFLGSILHRFTVVTVEVDVMMFGRDITLKSYAICALMTMGFSIFVNVVMGRVIKKIDMIESLKSVE